MEPRILVVDDDNLIRRIMRDTLVTLPATVLEATNGEEALQQAKAERPDLILLDTMMPGIDGFQTAELLKQDPWTGQIPLVFVSALGTSSHKVRGLDLGAEDYIAKPIDPEELKARVRSVLRRARPAAPPPAAAPPAAPTPAAAPVSPALASGQLQAMPLTSLVRWLALERRSARLHLTRASEDGELIFTEGQIARAAQGSRQGNTALFQLLTWREGTFEILPLPEDAATRGGEVVGSSEDLLQEGVRRSEELAELRAGLPGSEALLEIPAALRAAVRPGLPPEAAALLDLLDGTRNADQLLATSALDPWMTATILKRLLQLGAMGRAGGAEAARDSALRVPTEGSLQFQNLQALQQANRYALSPRGMFIQTASPYEVGDQVLVRFQLPGGTGWITAIAQVAWRTADPQQAKSEELGMGLTFVEVPPEALAAIEQRLTQGIVAQIREALQGL